MLLSAGFGAPVSNMANGIAPGTGEGAWIGALQAGQGPLTPAAREATVSTMRQEGQRKLNRVGWGC